MMQISLVANQFFDVFLAEKKKGIWIGDDIKDGDDKMLPAVKHLTNSGCLGRCLLQGLSDDFIQCEKPIVNFLALTLPQVSENFFHSCWLILPAAVLCKIKTNK